MPKRESLLLFFVVCFSSSFPSVIFVLVTLLIGLVHILIIVGSR